MRNKGNELAQEYGAAMRDYLAKGDENALQRAYELGRRALTDGFGLMDLTRAHQEALDLILTEAQTPGERERAWSLAPGFFTESLWSFEMVHRGFRETNRLLRELNSLLENRARELSCANDELKREIEGRFRLEELLLEREEALRGLSRQILVTGEEERKRISRELHDQVGQALTAINVNLAMLRKLKSSSAIGRKAADLQGLLSQTMETVHSFARELRPAMLDHLGLIPALHSYIRSFGKRTGLRIRLRAVTEVEALGMEEKTVLYRVTQEGLTNVAKHAKANRVTVAIRKLDGIIRMEVQDNGKAIRNQTKLNSARKSEPRLGLVGIQERVRLVNGKFSMESKPGKGTTIRVEIPFKIGGATAN